MPRSNKNVRSPGPSRSQKTVADMCLQGVASLSPVADEVDLPIPRHLGIENPVVKPDPESQEKVCITMWFPRIRHQMEKGCTEVVSRRSYKGSWKLKDGAQQLFWELPSPIDYTSTKSSPAALAAAKDGMTHDGFSKSISPSSHLPNKRTNCNYADTFPEAWFRGAYAGACCLSYISHSLSCLLALSLFFRQGYEQEGRIPPCSCYGE